MLEFRKDDQATDAAYESGRFQDTKRRSYISNSGHQFLRGKDRSRLREEVFRQSKGLCCACHRYRDSEHGDLEHEVGGRPKVKCDCFNTLLADGTQHTNVRWMCTIRPGVVVDSCHRKKHNREVRSGKVAA